MTTAGTGRLHRPYAVTVPATRRGALSFYLQWAVATLFCLTLIGAAVTKAIPLEMIEVLGFLTGGISVWLVARNNVWNWPIGLVNSAFYIYVFATARLYADATLQVFFIVTGIFGWYWWLRGGAQHTEAPVGHLTNILEGVAVGGLTTLGTIGCWLLLRVTNDVAPLADAFTTMVSVAATYLMARRLIENWYLWLTVDVVSITLYATKHLPLTAVLYVIYLSMCVVGLIGWRREYQKRVAV